MPISKRTSKTRRKNLRKRKRGGKNIFWLVMSTRGKEAILFARKPYKDTWISKEYIKDYKDAFRWFSIHGEYYPHNRVLERIPVDHLTPVKVKLIICGENPDLWIQRYKDCLFVNSHLETYYIGGNRNRKVTQVYHNFRLSNKLFPDVTEESGIVGVKIVKIDDGI